MTILQSIILGIVEGLTEYLPVSSTGHLMLASRVLALAQTEFVKTFEIAIQLGAITAVAWLYRKRFLLDRATVYRVLAAFMPAAVIGFAFYKVIKGTLLESDATVLWALAIGGFVLIVFERLIVKTPPSDGVDGGVSQQLAGLSYGWSVVIGCFQAISVIPGVSRSASTIIGGMAAGLSREAAVEFSFLLAVPTMVAATGYDLLKSAPAFSRGDLLPLGVGFVVSSVVAIIAVKWLVRFVQKHTLVPFGVYRIALAFAFWFFVLS